jgi:hypothetical protein
MFWCRSYEIINILKRTKHGSHQEQIKDVKALIERFSPNPEYCLTALDYLKEIVCALSYDSIGHAESLELVAKHLLKMRDSETDESVITAKMDEVAAAIIRYWKTPDKVVNALFFRFGEYAFQEGLASDKLDFTLVYPLKNFIHGEGIINKSEFDGYCLEISEQVVFRAESVLALARNPKLPELIADSIWCLKRLNYGPSWNREVCDIRRLIAECDTQSLKKSISELNSPDVPFYVKRAILHHSEKLPFVVRLSLLNSTDEDIVAASIWGLEVNGAYFSHPFRDQIDVDYEYAISSSFGAFSSPELAFSERLASFHRLTDMTWDTFLREHHRRIKTGLPTPYSATLKEIEMNKDKI